MAQIPYFNGYSWKDLTREERFYCFILYKYAIENPNDFADWVVNSAKLKILKEKEWDVGIEVCLYRDYRWHKGRPVRNSDFSPKRTFDLCLFASRTIIIIEAKVFQPLDSKQNVIFKKDCSKIKQLLKMDDIKVFLVSLTSSKYSSKALSVFDGRLTWEEAYNKYEDNLFIQANDLYNGRIRKLLNK
jgi:hypothetical protein